MDIAKRGLVQKGVRGVAGAGRRYVVEEGVIGAVRGAVDGGVGSRVEDDKGTADVGDLAD